VTCGRARRIARLTADLAGIVGELREIIEQIRAEAPEGTTGDADREEEGALT